MQLLAVQNAYGNEGDCFDTAFLKPLEKPSTGFEVFEGNADLSADWPAAIGRTQMP
jgi:hypothetical protein